MFNSCKNCRFVSLCLAFGVPLIFASCNVRSDVPRKDSEPKPRDSTIAAESSRVLAAERTDAPRTGSKDKARDPRIPAERLRVRAAERSDYSLLVGVPLASPKQWATVTKVDDDFLVVTGHGTLPLSDVNAFIVAYPNGQLVDYNMIGLAVPAGITGLSPSLDSQKDILQLSDLDLGKQYVRTNYGNCPAFPNDRDHYSTSLTNLSTEKIKVQRFAGYGKTTQGWELSTVTNKFYSAEEFREWYGLQDNNWILPGQTAVDLNNYGSRPVLWAYYCESESGKRFVAGSVLD